MILASIKKKLKWLKHNFMKIYDYAMLNYYKDTLYVRTIKKSPLFDEAYYRRNNPDISASEDAAEHYLKNGMLPGRDPSEFFCSEEYLSLHCDVAVSKMNPLLSYELFGRGTNYEISSLQRKKLTFPKDAQAVKKNFTNNPVKKKRDAITACFFSDGRIPETLLILLKGLKEITDNIVLIGDCPIYPSELDKLEGLVCYAEFQRHLQYDFGSYKRGLKYLHNSGLLNSDSIDELIILNDSCFGPVYPLSEILKNMENEACDFWGFNGYKHGRHRYFKSYISSNFYVFRKKVVFSGYIDEFFDKIEREYDRNGIISKLESEFTAFLEEKGFLWQTVCDDYKLDSIYNPLSLLKDYKIPLVKKKAFQRIQHEDMNDVLKIIQENNPKLREYINFNPIVLADYKLPSIKEHQSTLPLKIQKLSQKTAKKEKISALFLTGVWDKFPSKNLFKAICNDSAFNTQIAIIPDLRKDADSKMEILLEMAKYEKELQNNGIEGKRILQIRPDHINLWPDICDNFDIVFYKFNSGNIEAFSGKGN